MTSLYLKALSRPATTVSLVLRPSLRPTEILRRYATTHSSSTRSTRKKNITVLSDDGMLQWGELSGKEKMARATQQSFNFVIVLAGAVLTVCTRIPPYLNCSANHRCKGGVFTLLYLEVFSPNSRTWQFEKAVERIKDDARCTKLLGDRREIKAYGENTWSRWQRNRPVA